MLPFFAPDPNGTTRGDRAQARAAVTRFSYRWTVTECVDRPARPDQVRRHLVVELHGAVAMSAFHLDRHADAVVLSEHDATGAWTLGRFGAMTDALSALRWAAMARFTGLDASPAPGRATVA